MFSDLKQEGHKLDSEDHLIMAVNIGDAQKLSPLRKHMLAFKTKQTNFKEMIR